MRRRSALALLAALALPAGCGTSSTPPGPRLRHLYLATGNTTGVYYQLGGGYADAITAYLPGYDATAEPTGASVENVRRVIRGDADIAFSLADTAADAVTGKGPFDKNPQRLSALAKLYANYTQVIVRAGTEIRSIADMEGKRVSTGSPQSGTEVVALRMLAAAGLNPKTDVVTQALSLPQTVKGMQAGTTDAMFFCSGLPAGGLTDLFNSGPAKYQFLAVDGLLTALQQQYGDVYTAASIPKTAYNTAADVPTIVVPNLLVVAESMPEALAYDLTRLLFEKQSEIAKSHPEANHIDRATANGTRPVPLHPGAARYFASVK